jgi:L-threonylcarbamoyladenylate synthase
LSPTTAEHVANAFEDGIECVLDGGPSSVGVESSVLAWRQGRPVLLRPGGIPVEALEEVLGVPVSIVEGDGLGAQPSPGMLPWHYAPSVPLTLSEAKAIAATTTAENEGLLWFGDAEAPAGYARVENLSPSGDLREAAANLFAALHRLDASGAARISRIRAARVPDEGLGRAINERLEKASKKT